MSMAAYQQAFDALPDAQRAARRQAYARFAEQGFPGRQLEEWRYTDLSALSERRFEAAEETAAPPFEPLEDGQLVMFANGHRVGGPAQALAGGLVDDGITALNAALFRDGLDRIVDRSAPQPQRLHLRTWNGGAGAAAMAHLRHRLVVERGCEALLFLDIAGDDREFLSTQVLEIELQAGAKLTLVRLQALGAGTTDISRTEIRLARDARLDYVGLDLGGAVARHDLNVHLGEPGAQVRMSGVFAPAGRTHTDTHTRILHAAPHTSSRELFRGLVLDRAKAVFNGRIVVEPGAQKTDSEQHLGTLLLSPKAEIDAKPELEIYADDVKCAHGNTCGQLDEAAVYYLRTRGLDREAARNLLTYTFAHQALAALGDEPLRKRLGRALLAQLPASSDMEELL